MFSIRIMLFIAVYLDNLISINLLLTMNILDCAHKELGKQHFVLAGPKFQVLNVLQRVTACEIAQVAEMTNNL